jgi:DNA helicase HerA-like ATPase
MKPPVLGSDEGSPVRIDVEQLVASRALIAAQSGYGKSWTLRRILEQTRMATCRCGVWVR